jgi:hypothetical protein
MVDQSVRTDEEAIPAEINRWNWGAFLLSWVWGVGNNTFIASLALIPLFGLIMPFVLGAKGSAWAWSNGRWDSVTFQASATLVGNMGSRNLASADWRDGWRHVLPSQTLRGLRTRSIQSSGQHRSGQCSRRSDIDRPSVRLDFNRGHEWKRDPQLFGDRHESHRASSRGRRHEGRSVVAHQTDAHNRRKGH